jgi:hypothetical protein
MINCFSSLFKYHHMRTLFFFLILLPVSLFAQKAVIQEVERPMTTYPFSDPDPVARPGRVYPYFRFDVYTNHPVTQEWRMVELENDYIRLAIMPDMGGKVWEAYEKSGDFPFIFSGHTVKFRDVALRGAWTSDGLEFNFGDIRHNYIYTCGLLYQNKSRQQCELLHRCY